MNSAQQSAPHRRLADLAADGPHPDLAEHAAVFGRFVGDWDMDVEFFDGGERVYRRPGLWSFGWVLDGRALQDVLSYPIPGDPEPAEPGRRRIGTSIRTVDPATGIWQVVWLGVVSGVTVVLHGGPDGERIRLLSQPEPDGTLNRWEFSDISPDRFTWTGHESVDGGDTWYLRQRMTGERRAREAR